MLNCVYSEYILSWLWVFDFLWFWWRICEVLCVGKLKMIIWVNEFVFDDKVVENILGVWVLSFLIVFGLVYNEMCRLCKLVDL